MIDIKVIHEEWSQLRSLYETFAQHIRSSIGVEAHRRGIVCATECRAKDVPNLLKKCLKKNYSLDQIGDKAGVRVIVPYSGLVNPVGELIGDLFDVRDRDDKTSKLEPTELGYLGVHFQVRLRESDIRETGQFNDLECEIQLHTRAQNLWSDTSHDLSYKPPTPLPKDVQRAINRLVVLSEIFDSELENARRTILDMPGYEEARILDCLEKNYYKLSPEQFDRELSLLVISSIKGILDPQDVEAYGAVMDEFVEANKDQIRKVFEDYSSDLRDHLLVTQPESLLLFRELERDRFRLKDNWPLPIDLLEALANAWGTTVIIDG